MASPTPGPWMAAEREGNGGKGWVVEVASRGRIADVARRSEPDITEANARLLAAAPDLLAVAEEWRRYFDDATAGRPAYGPILDRTKQALAKAGAR